MKEMIYEVAGLLPTPVVIALEKELTISEDIDDEVDKAAARYGYYAVLSEKAETRYQRLDMSFERWRAETVSRKNRELQDGGEKKYTEAQMEAFLKSQPKYTAYQLKLIEFGEHRRVLKAVARAFEKKAELTQTKASNRRSETIRGRTK